MGFFMSLAFRQTSHCYNDLTELCFSYKICDFITINFFSRLRLIVSRMLIGRMVKLAKAEAGIHQAVN